MKKFMKKIALVMAASLLVADLSTVKAFASEVESISEESIVDEAQEVLVEDAAEVVETAGDACDKCVSGNTAVSPNTIEVPVYVNAKLVKTLELVQQVEKCVSCNDIKKVVEEAVVAGLPTLDEIKSYIPEGCEFVEWRVPVEGGFMFITEGDDYYEDYLFIEAGLRPIADEYGFAFEAIEDQTYTGKKIVPTVNVYGNGALLTAGVDYTVKAANNVNAQVWNATNARGKSIAPYVTITGKGRYAGAFKRIIPFTIKPAAISGNTIVDPSALVKVAKRNDNEQVIKPVVKSALTNKALKLNKDYELVGNKVTKAGDYKITIKAKEGGNYTGSTTVDAVVVRNDIKVKKLSAAKVTLAISGNNIPSKGVAYSGNQITPDVTVKNVDAKVYDVAYGENVEIGKGSVTVTAKAVSANDIKADTKEVFVGSKTVSFKIFGTPINSLYKATVSGNYVYNGDEQKPVVKVELKPRKTGDALVEGVDYVIDYSQVKNAGNRKAFIVGKGKYTGKIAVKVKVEKAPIAGLSAYLAAVSSNAVSSNNPHAWNYDNVTLANEVSSSIVVPANYAKLEYISVYGMGDLVPNKDYKIVYKNMKIGKAATLVITGKGNFAGTSKVAVKVVADSMTNYTVEAADIAKATRGDQKTKTAITVYDTFGNKVAAKNYTVAEATVSGNNVSAVITAKDNKNYVGSVTANYRIIDAKKLINNAKIQLENQTFTVSGNFITKQADFKKAELNGATLTLGKDIKVVGYKNNFRKGVATVTFKGIGEFGGTKKVTFKILTKDYTK